MSSILYYSNFCEPSKKLLNIVGKTQNTKDIHFICIDKRIKDNNGKIFIVLPNGQQIIMPENVTKVPALLLLNQNYRVVYGDEIYAHLKPQKDATIKQSTQNNMEPSAFQDGFGGFGMGGVSSDEFSFLDQNDDDLGVKGNGGMRQMHNYTSLSGENDTPMHCPEENYTSGKITDGEKSMEQLQKQRDLDVANMR